MLVVASDLATASREMLGICRAVQPSSRVAAVLSVKGYLGRQSGGRYCPAPIVPDGAIQPMSIEHKNTARCTQVFVQQQGDLQSPDVVDYFFHELF
jgi:hypothetical protein